MSKQTDYHLHNEHVTKLVGDPRIPADDRADALDVCPGGDLRDNPAVLGVQLHLRADHIRTDLETVDDDSGGGLVAGALDSKDGVRCVGHFHSLGR